MEGSHIKHVFALKTQFNSLMEIDRNLGRTLQEFKAPVVQWLIFGF